MEPKRYVDLFLLAKGKAGPGTQQSNTPAPTLFDFQIVNIIII